MQRNVLLIEPNYKNKYPPMGLMKLATYHRMLGDNVRFFKGDLNEFIIQEIVSMQISKFTQIDKTILWSQYRDDIYNQIKHGINDSLEEIIDRSDYNALLYAVQKNFRKYYKSGEYKQHPRWDRICISTLFTFHWDITIKTIEKAKELVRDTTQIFVGGVLATVLQKELMEATNVRVLPGLLNYKNALDNNDIIIDVLPLDYSILFETNYLYPANNSFFSYATRGCTNRCDFCAVPILENEFNNYISIKGAINSVKKNYGDMPNLLLLDNNVLASDKFEEIITDIKQCGFEKGALFTEPNYLSIYISKLKSGYNDYGFSRAVFQLYKQLLDCARDIDKQKIYNILYNNKLLDIKHINKKSLLDAYKELYTYYEKYKDTAKRRRIVDFNQGLEALKITEEKAKLLSEIAVNPLRIAFDSVKETKIYVRAIKRCARYGIKSFSNYLLYNFDDEPVELYKRLKINVMLCDKLKISIYSFPMKFHPVTGEYSKNRDFIGCNWNKKYIRAIQIILNATKGKIGKGKSFFYKAFGKNIEEFHTLLLMPETYLLYRFFCEYSGMTDKWKNDYAVLTIRERHEFHKLIDGSKFNNETYSKITNSNIKEVYKHYLVTRKDIEDVTTKLGKQKLKYDSISANSESY